MGVAGQGLILIPMKPRMFLGNLWTPNISFLTEPCPPGPISMKLGQNVPWVTLFLSCSRNLDWPPNMGVAGRGLFWPRNLWTTSPPEPLGWFQWNFTRMFLGWPSSKVVQEIWIDPQIWAWQGGALFWPQNLWMTSPPEPLGSISMKLYRMFLGWPSSKVVQEIWIDPQIWAWQGGAYFDPKIFEWHLLLNHWADFNETLPECSLGDPLTKVVQEIWIDPQIWAWQGRAYFDPKIFEMTSPPEPLGQFQWNFTRMFLGWPSSKVVQEIWIDPQIWAWQGRAFFDPEIFERHLLLNH